MAASSLARSCLAAAARDSLAAAVPPTAAAPALALLAGAVPAGSLATDERKSIQAARSSAPLVVNSSCTLPGPPLTTNTFGSLAGACHWQPASTTRPASAEVSVSRHTMSVALNTHQRTTLTGSGCTRSRTLPSQNDDDADDDIAAPTFSVSPQSDQKKGKKNVFSLEKSRFCSVRSPLRSAEPALRPPTRCRSRAHRCAPCAASLRRAVTLSSVWESFFFR
jgi:hypothetical protein